MLNLKNIKKKEISQLTISKMKTYLKSIGSTYSFKTKDRYINRLNVLHDYLNFPWREDQQKVIDNFLQGDMYDFFVINGIFGCGKTTLLLGLLINSIIQQKYKADDLFFLSFNVCIRNELRRKLRVYGLSKRTKVRTFDSIIYEICKNYKYPHLDLPNFNGKRLFVYNICEKIKNNKIDEIPIVNQPKVLFIDETQDLEKQTLLVFKTFFSQSKIVFAGDIFQSIQKEPRESLLWHLLYAKYPNTYKVYFKETPRVPRNILSTLKRTLSDYYPEFKDNIQSWKSSNTSSDADIIWKRLYSYSNVFNCVENFCNEHKKEETMILTFSSAITVRGSLGDIARLRRFLQQNNYDVNKNHKQMNPEKLFLSTANSSKGLERDNVLVFLTFPLERAFINFSDDLVVNLITVALTRARKKVVIYVPAYHDKFSRVLQLYHTCPKPNKKKIREGKTLKDFGFSDYLDMEHCVTSLIKQSIISYDTRIKLKEYIKMYNTSKVFTGKPIKRPILQTEEERALVGIVIENLITSSWLNKWPMMDDYTVLKDHPMYIHCYKKIEKVCKKYNSFTKKYSCSNYSKHFEGIILYSQAHIAMYNKIFITLPKKIIDVLQNYWKSLSSRTYEFKPKSGKIEPQTNLRMPWITGIADIVVTKTSKVKKNDREDEFSDLDLWELKASIDMKWKDNALTQVALYALMTGKMWSRLVLLNPFRNEKNCYYFNTKNIMKIRKLVTNDIITWNANCFLAKNYNPRNKRVFNTENKLFIHIFYEDDNISQFSIIRMLSPTKIQLLCDQYFNHDVERNKKMSKREKLQLDSEIDISKSFDKINEILNSNVYCNYEIWSMNNIDNIKSKINRNINDSKDLFGEDITDIQKTLSYEKNKDLKYSLDFDDSVTQNISRICHLSTIYKLL